MQVFCLVLLSAVAYSNSQDVSLNFVIPIAKQLDNGRPVTPPAYINVNADKTGVSVSFDLTKPDDFGEVISTSVYFANDAKAITQITFEKGTMIAAIYNKPWQWAGDKTQMDENAQATKTNVVIPQEWLPADITRVSASMMVQPLAPLRDTIPVQEGVILNYYGIKNFAISLPDTFVVESYMLADFSPLTSSDNGDAA